MDNKFRFWVPANIEKATDKDGKKIMKLGGIASCSAEDSDGEELITDGFDISYLKSCGTINWHHQSKNSPAAIIGEPTKAEIRKDGLFVEATLYPDSKIAREVYELAEVLEKNSKTRRLGFSVEGTALARDPNNQKKIIKAAITAVAVTHQPKNPKTLAEIIKGITDDEEEIYS